MATLATLEKREVEQFAREFEKLFYQGDFVAISNRNPIQNARTKEL
jgi:hypothetical protein